MTKKPALDFTDGKEVRVVKPTFADLDIVGVPIPAPSKLIVPRLISGALHIYDDGWQMLGRIANTGIRAQRSEYGRFADVGGRSVAIKAPSYTMLDLQLNFDDRDTEAGKAAFALLDRNLSRRDKDRMAIVQGNSTYMFDAVVMSVGVTRSDFMMTTHINLTFEISNVEAVEN